MNKTKKICFFSDAHGNGYAFKEILKSIKEQVPDLYVYCGDICGYYYNQNEIISLLSKIPKLECILGNHDKIFLDMMDSKILGDEYKEKYGMSNHILMRNIKRESLNFLRKLDDELVIEIDGHELGVYHGSPWNHLDEYIYPDSNLKRFEKLRSDFIILGHTHYRMDLHAGSKRIINPGSCGQPRDVNKPSYAILEVGTGNLGFFSVDYDKSALIREIKSNDKIPYLTDVIVRGRSSYG